MLYRLVKMDSCTRTEKWKCASAISSAAAKISEASHPNGLEMFDLKKIEREINTQPYDKMD